MFHIILNEEALPEPYDTESEAHEAAEAMVKALAERGEDASYVIWVGEKVN